jgi:hypothetical protein
MKLRKTYAALACGILFALGAGQSLAAGPAADPKQDAAVVIEQSRGVDPSVDYASLVRFGPWDDRNYELTAADIALLPENDRPVRGVPAFYKVQKRQEMAAEGHPIEKYYPRELDKEFLHRYGGLLQNGKLDRRGLGVYTHPDPQNPPPNLIYATDPLPHAVPVEGEGPMAIGNNETGIEYNPVDPDLVIAGSNGPGGQSMNYSNDGGVTWLSGGVLPSTCCDPASDWSSDGAVAYTASLGGSGSFRTVVFRSTNFGQNWSPAVQVSTGGSDKEYIHVDKSASSPFLDYVYTTWHQGNTMFFARSTDRALTFQTPISFPSAARGIGSDITTDAQGRIFYAWPSTSNHPTSAIWVVTSTDGGATFSAPVQAYDLHGEFDFAIPSMESRRAFIYISADTDQSGGPNDGRVYLAFTDEAPNSPGNGGGSAAASHGWVQVIYSDDQGATWQVAATPHSTADQATVDRYHPWLDVDDNGVVHIGFYDTRNSTNRTGVDFYYVYSADGGASWTDETRVSQIVSQNINNGQEWGDYNGLSVSRANVVAMSWTDNRIPSGGGSPQQKSFVGRVTNVAGGPSYQLAVSGGALSVCAGQPIDPIAFTARAFGGFSAPVTLSFPGIDTSVFPTSTATPNPITPAEPPAAGTINLSTAPAAAAGTYDITLFGTDGGASPTERSVEFEVTVASGIPGSATLTAPANGASGVPTLPAFSWSGSAAAVTYTIEVATDSAFSNIVATDTVEETTWTPGTALTPNTSYFWRVRANSPCGDSGWSATFSFSTGVTFPEPYCEWDVTNDIEPITLVNYAGINNRTSAAVNGSPAHEDYTAIVGNVAPGSTASMAVEGNTAGDFNTLVTAFADWNRDGDFADAGETYQIGNIDNSTGNDGQQAVADIAVPASVTNGPTRLRVVKKYNTAAGPCNTDGYGQAEDYTLMVGTGGTTYTVGGNVNGLTGSGLALSLNGSESLPLAANGVFTFSTQLNDGAAYAVTVGTQPAGQTCSVANGSGTIAGANVTNVAVTCTTGTVDAIFADGFDGEVVAVCEPLQLFEDTSFEATSASGGPNTFWDSDSTTGDSVFWSSGSVRTGTYAVWMGGYGGGAPETMYGEQSVVFTGSNRYLNFWRMNARQGGGVSDVKFIVDGNTVHTDSTLALPVDADWVSQSVDLSAYADGLSHTVRIQYDHDGTGEDANYFLDDATLDCEAAPAGQHSPSRGQGAGLKQR